MTRPDQPNSPVNELSDRFWEGILELNPTTATVYGDERYDDRLEDPSPAGRAKARGPDGADEGGGRGDLRRTACRSRTGSPGTCSSSSASSGIEEDDQGTHRLRVVDQIGGPQTLLPQLCQFQRADTPERLEKFLARLRAYRRYMAANTDILREGLETGLTAPRIVAERTRPAAGAAAGDPDRGGDRPVDGPGRLRGGPRAGPRSRPGRGLPGRCRVPRGASGRLPRGDPGTSPASGRRPSGDSLYRTQIRAWTTLDLDPRDVHQIGMEELEATKPAGARSPERAGFGDDTKAYRASLATDPGEHPEVEGRADRPRPRGHRPGDGDRAALLRDAAAGRLRGQGGRGVQGEGRPVRLLLPAVDRRLARRASTTPTATTCRAASTRSSPRRPTTRRSRATTSRSPSRWRTRTSTRSAASARGWSAAPTSRAGACTARSSPTRWASSATTPSGSGCSTRSPGGPPGSSSTPASTRCAGPASSRSTSCSRPACRRPTRSSRPIATSPGRARR